MVNLKVIGSVLFCVLILSLKAGEDDNLLEINKKIAGRVSFVFFLAASFCEFLRI